MDTRQPRRLSFSSKQKQVLQNLEIQEDSPGAILHDFGVLTDYLKEGGLPVTGTHQLPFRVLPEMNSRLTHPIELGLKRPRPKSYPHINGLYLLLRASGLSYVAGSSKKPSLVLDDAVYRQWEEMNPTERYGTLLETWMLRARPSIIGEREHFDSLVPDSFRECMHFAAWVPEEGSQVTGDKTAEDTLRYTPGLYNIGLLELFGLIGVEHGLPEAGKGWCIERIYPTPLGDALLALLHAEFFADYANIFRLQEEGRIPFGILQRILEPYLSEWKKNLSIPDWAFREGTHIFKVSLGRIWRRIEVPADCSLHELSSTILDSVEFDADHLYAFTYRNRFGGVESASHPYTEEEPQADEVLVGEVPLLVGQTMRYVFDFGDHWEFGVTLEQVDPERVVENPAILETHGESPEQYPSWDEDDSWDEDE